jgi:hypothetical protein
MLGLLMVLEIGMLGWGLVRALLTARFRYSSYLSDLFTYCDL